MGIPLSPTFLVHCRTGSYHTTNVIIYFESSFVDFYHFICRSLISTIDNT
ncbi:hypothetical protein HMPREF0208_04008 [Citrobacter koseri]|nr:hypothetical protein HMPREF3207_01510 [Citrobacter koseri]KXB40873.1 hypothetical protein HMPREF0208_04008 [Citrobacter koseri]